MPRASRTDDPRKAILAAARALVRQGHEDVSLRAVAARAGFSPASLYEYFDGKDAILGALAEEASTRLRKSLEQAVGAAPDPRSALVELGIAYVRFAKKHREDFLLLFSRLVSRRRGTADGVPAGSSAYAILRDAVGRALPDGPTDELAYALWATAHGMAMLQSTHLAGFQADFETADRRTLTALVAGLVRMETR